MNRLPKMAMLALLLLAGCTGYRRVEKTDTFSQQQKDIKNIVLLEPDYFRYDETTEQLVEDPQTLEKMNWVNDYNTEALHRLGVTRTWADNNTNGANKDVLTALMLKQQVRRLCLDFQLHSFSDWEDYSEKKVLSQDLYISPEYSSLLSGYQTPYFYYTLIIEHDGIFSINALADVSQGKIIYTEIKKVSLPAGKANLWQMMFGSLNLMLAAK